MRDAWLRLLHDVDPTSLTIEGHDPIHECEERVVLAPADVSTRVIARAALPNQDAAGANVFAAVTLDPQPLTVRISAVTYRTLTFLVSHDAFPHLFGKRNSLARADADYSAFGALTSFLGTPFPIGAFSSFRRLKEAR